MRAMTFAVVTVMVSAMIGLATMHSDDVSPPSQSSASVDPVSQSKDMREALSAIAQELRAIESQRVTALQEENQERKKIAEVINALSSRLDSVEKLQLVRHDAQALSPTQDTRSDATEENIPSTVAPQTKMSGKQLGQWMSNNLALGSLDEKASTQAMEQALASVANLPKVNLDDMQCDTRFCRATFSHRDGIAPEIGEIFGQPPFLTEGFTINEADGRVALFFTQPGVSLEDVRVEAARN